MNVSFRLDRDRLSVLSGALVLGLALGRFVQTPVRPLVANVLGSPLGLNISATTLMLLLMTGMSITATESLVRSHPLARRKELSRSTHFWIVPGLLVLALAGWLATVEDIGLWTAGLLASAILLPLALAAEYTAIDPDRRTDATLQWGHLALVYLTAAVLYTLIYDLDARALISGTAVLLVTALLVTRLFWYMVDKPASALLYGGTVGILASLMTWVLNYWPLSALQGGLLLLLFFYVVVGPLQQVRYGRFSRRVVLEYALVAVIGLLIIAFGVSG